LARLATAITSSTIATTIEKGSYDPAILLELHLVATIVKLTGLPVRAYIQYKKVENFGIRIEATYQCLDKWLAGFLASLTTIDESGKVLMGSSPLHNSVDTAYCTSKAAREAILKSPLFIEVLAKHHTEMFGSGCATLRFLHRDEDESPSQAVLLNDNSFQLKLGRFKAELRETYAKILDTAAGPNAKLRLQLIPVHDAIFGHIMLHPAHKTFYASSAQHALIQEAFHHFANFSGLYRGVFLDPIEEAPGRYLVLQGSSTQGCIYESHGGD